jgi:hypothetical protein
MPQPTSANHFQTQSSHYDSERQSGTSWRLTLTLPSLPSL